MTRDEQVQENLKLLNTIAYKIADLSRIKEELEARVCALVEHGDEGSKTYVEGKFKVTVTTGYNYTLNKEEYEVLGARLPEQFNPVTKRVSYDLNKNIIRDAEKYASFEELSLLAQLIQKKPKKLHVKISAGV